jgi:hypothetical protein
MKGRVVTYSDSYTFEHPSDALDKVLVDILYNSHGEVLDVRVRTKRGHGARWSRMWKRVTDRQRVRYE